MTILKRRYDVEMMGLDEYQTSPSKWHLMAPNGTYSSKVCSGTTRKWIAISQGTDYGAVENLSL